jgi:mycobactin lysine-N-oxygenase
VTDADLIVVGAGPKATAIAAKVHAINQLGLGPISLLVIEEVESAASWSGVNGMTSGEETLAISPLKDVGFPYETHRTFGAPGEAIDGLLSEFSWQRHLIEDHRYASWLNAGMPPVQHREYGRYLAWALALARNGVELIRGRVTGVSLAPGRDGWEVATVGPVGSARHRGRALALTGSGVHRPLSHDPQAAPRIFHCDSRRSELARIPADRACDIAVVGGGDGGLSCIVYLRSVRPSSRLTVYTPTPPLSRGESFLENRVFSDPDCVAWASLDVQARRAFIRHADRGVCDPAALAQLAGDDRCTFVVGRVTHVAAGAEGLSVEHDAPGGPASARHDYVINCTGFDLLRQLRSLFGAAARAELEALAGPIWERPSGSELVFGRMLELAGVYPRLHIPGLAALSQGPGFANLGCLGLLSSRVLQAFVLDEADMRRERAAA